MTESLPSRIDVLVHEMNYSGLPNLSTMLANALLENNIAVRLLVVGEPAEIPFPTHKNLQVKFFGIERSPHIIGKTLYVLRVYFILSTFLAKERSKNVFMLGKEFIALAVIIKVSLLLRFKIGGFNDNNISLHIQHNTPFILRPLLNLFYKTTLPSADYIVSQSEGMTEDLVKIYGVDNAKITTIPPIVNARYFLPAQENKAKTGKILFVGKLMERKQPFKIIEIFTMLENKIATLEFVGGGELEEALKEKVAELGLQGRISFAGSQGDTVPYIQKADVVVLASQYEGLPMVLVESIACGVPVVSFNCPTGPSEIIIDGVNGYLIPQDNIELFAKKLDKALAQEWNHKKIADTAKKFHPDKVIKQYLDAIKKNLA